MESSKWTWIATTVCALAALLAPFECRYIIYEPEMSITFTLRSLVWRYESYSYPEFIFEPLGLWINAIHTFLRFWFVYEVYRVYSMDVPRVRAVIVGVVSEFWWVVVMTSSSPFVTNLPVPILLLVGLALLGLRRPLKLSEAWTDEPGSEQN